MKAREALREAVGLGVDDEIHVALAVQRDVLGTVPRHAHEAHALEQLAERLRIGRGVFDELEAIGAHRVHRIEGEQSGIADAGHEDLPIFDAQSQLVSYVTIMPSRSQALELENFLPYRLSVLAQLVSESLHDLYAGPFDLSVTQWRVMAALGRFAPLTASAVGQRIVVDKVAVSRAVAGLMQRGLIERAPDQDDRRRAPLKLSARGQAMHDKIVPLALSYEARLYTALSANERTAFEALSDRLLEHAKSLRPEA